MKKEQEKQHMLCTSSEQDRNESLQGETEMKAQTHKEHEEEEEEQEEEERHRARIDPDGGHGEGFDPLLLRREHARAVGRHGGAALGLGGGGVAG